MVASIAQLIGKINPGLYAKNGKDLLKKYKSADEIPAEEIEPQAVKYSKTTDQWQPSVYQFKLDKGETGIEASHGLVYETYAEAIEPVYFFLVDLMEEFGLKPEKLIDNFTAAPGSTQFAELGGRATAMQAQAIKMMGDVNTLVRGVLNLIYDLKEMKMRIQTYEDYKNPNLKYSALLSLKQIWMDKVDMQKGNSAIKALANSQVGFVTLIDAFLAAQTKEEVEKLDLNDRVRRILIQRIAEFNQWVAESDRELRKRFEIEKTYLKAQVDNLKIYSRWARPYFLAAQKLEQKERTRDVSLVNTFNRIVLELTVMGKKKISPKDLAVEGTFPEHLKKEKNVIKLRDYFEVVLIDFIFRAVPIQGKLIGKVEITFRGYSLNKEELAKLEELLDESDINEMLKLVEGVTEDTLIQIKEDLDEYINDISPKKSEEEKPSEDVNPFLAMLGFYNKKPEKPASSGSSDSKKKKEKVVIKSESYDEKSFCRPYAAGSVVETVFTLFDVYKKAHGMPSFV